MIDGLKHGDVVILKCNGEQYQTHVMIVSPNGKSLVLEFEALIHGHVGMMPVATDDAGNYYELVTGEPIELSRPQ